MTFIFSDTYEKSWFGLHVRLVIIYVVNIKVFTSIWLIAKIVILLYIDILGIEQ